MPGKYDIHAHLSWSCWECLFWDDEPKGGQEVTIRVPCSGALGRAAQAMPGIRVKGSAGL